ncbi:hypothetical protein KC330_g98 [Hortaea werneckii]|nr:hypothetical protein KC330_g98 [Hortaea werneckii]
MLASVPSKVRSYRGVLALWYVSLSATHIIQTPLIRDHYMIFSDTTDSAELHTSVRSADPPFFISSCTVCKTDKQASWSWGLGKVLCLLHESKYCLSTANPFSEVGLLVVVRTSIVSGTIKSSARVCPYWPLT